MLNRSQQVAEHRATRTCFLASSPLCPPLIFTDLSKKKISFVTEREVKHMLAQSTPPHGFSLTHTHILKESISSLYSLSASLGGLP